MSEQRLAVIPCCEVRAGTRLRADGGFTCLLEGEVVTVEADGDMLFVPCVNGKHDLDGQRDFDTGETYVGFFPVSAEAR